MRLGGCDYPINKKTTWIGGILWKNRARNDRSQSSDQRVEVQLTGDLRTNEIITNTYNYGKMRMHTWIDGGCNRRIDGQKRMDAHLDGQLDPQIDKSLFSAGFFLAF